MGTLVTVEKKSVVSEKGVGHAREGARDVGRREGGKGDSI